MIPSRTLVAPGLRTAANRGRSAHLAVALHLVRTRPTLWLLGSLGFMLRGGILLLALPIVVLPTQVEVRFILGGYLGSSGLTPGFYVAVGILTAVSFAVGLGGLYILARVELAAFRRLVRDDATLDQRAGIKPRRLDANRRRAVVTRLFVLQALTLLLLLLAALPLAVAVGQTTFDEIVRPSSTDSIYVRVLAQVGQPLLVLVVSALLIDALSAIATRTVLARAFGLAVPRRGLPARMTQVLSDLLTMLIGWAVVLLALLSSLWALSVAWQATRSVFLAGGSSVQPAQLVIGALLLGGVWAAVLAASGFADALRRALWSLGGLH